MKEDFIMKYKKSIFTLFILLFILYIYSSDNYSQSENQAIPYHDYIVDVITTKSAYNDKYSAHIPKEDFHALNQSRYQNTVDTAAKVTVDIKQENYSVENGWGYLYPLSTTWQNLLIYDCTMNYTINFYDTNNELISQINNQIHFIIHQAKNDDSWFIVQYHEEP